MSGNRRLLVALVALALVVTGLVAPTAPAPAAQAATGTKYEAEDATLAGGASIAACGNCSGDEKVGSIGNGSGTVTFTVSVPTSGDYGVSLAYLTGATRSVSVAANADPAVTVSLAPSTWDNWVGYKGVTVELDAGSNTITLSNSSGWAPDLDYIRVLPGDFFDVSGAPVTSTTALERPSVIDYTNVQVSKMFLSIPIQSGGTRVTLTFEQALERIKTASRIDGNAPKVVYLVGWQYDGHDDQYPAWGLVNDALKRPGDATAVESLVWLMEEARDYNTTVSLHINMTDAFVDSDLWTEYNRDGSDLIKRESDGDDQYMGTWGGEPAYGVNWTREWESGFAQSRINDLLDLLPIEEAGTIHIDAYFPDDELKDPGDVIDPYHGTTNAQERETQRKVIRYWRDLGIDVTSEHAEQYGLQPAVWWRYGEEGTIAQAWARPASLIVSGESQRCTGWTCGSDILVVEAAEREFMIGSYAMQEGNWNSPEFERRYASDFARLTLHYLYLNDRSRGTYSNFVANYSGNLVADTSSRTPSTFTLVDNGRTVRTGDDLLLPASWITTHSQLMAFSTAGYSPRSWTLPPSWSSVSRVDLYRNTGRGYVPLGQGLPVSSGAITFGLGAGELVSIVPAGTTMTGLAADEIDIARYGSASSNDGVAGDAIDGDDGSAWVSATGGFPRSLTIDLEAVRPVTRIEQTWSDIDDGGSALYNFIIEGSSNGTDWTPIADETAATGKHYVADAYGSFRYIKLTVRGIADSLHPSTGVATSHLASSRSFEVYSPAVDLAGSASVTASTNNGNVPGNAVDGNAATAWVASSGSFTNQWLQADLGTARDIASVTHTYSETDGSVFKYVLEGSNGGGTWTTIADRTAGVTGNVRVDQVNATYRWVRVRITDINNGHWANLQDLRILAAPKVLPATMTSSSSNINGAALAADGFESTAWVAASGSFSPPVTLTADLGSSLPLSHVRQVFGETDGSTFSYQIHVSNDNAIWTLVRDASGGVTGRVRDERVTGDWQYVRLTVTGINNGHWANSLEFRAWG